MPLSGFSGYFQINKPSLEEGEFWHYKLYSTFAGNYSKNADIVIKVKGFESFNFNGNNINALILEVTRNDTIIEGENVTHESKYMKEYLDENLSVFRIEESYLQTGKQKTYEYNPPIGLNWPLFINKSWIRFTHTKIYEDGKSYLRNVTLMYNCTHEEIVHVDAGTFDCIAVEWIVNGDYANRTVQYYSLDAGFGYVKMEKYWKGGIALVTELVSHSVKRKVSESKGTPGFDVFLLILSLIIATEIIMMKKIRL